VYKTSKQLCINIYIVIPKEIELFTSFPNSLLCCYQAFGHLTVGISSVDFRHLLDLEQLGKMQLQNPAINLT
jgi:uncharacterized protein YjfI (DUF2170 family)